MSTAIVSLRSYPGLVQVPLHRRPANPNRSGAGDSDFDGEALRMGRRMLWICRPPSPRPRGAIFILRSCLAIGPGPGEPTLAYACAWYLQKFNAVYLYVCGAIPPDTPALAITYDGQLA